VSSHAAVVVVAAAVPARRARYVLIHTLTDSEKTLNLEEVTAYGPDGTRLVPAGGRMSSSVDTNHIAKNCIDWSWASTKNGCQSDSASDREPWFQIDYGESRLVPPRETRL
jgi:hypothetical protein